IELGDQALQPSRVPPVVIAHPGEILRRGPLARGDLGYLAPRGDHRVTLIVLDIAKPTITLRVFARDLLGAVTRGIVQEGHGESAAGLCQERFDRVREMMRVVVERHPEHDARPVRVRGSGAGLSRADRFTSSLWRRRIEAANEVAIARLRRIEHTWSLRWLF